MVTIEPFSDGKFTDENRHRDNDDEDDKYVTKHFDFRLNGDIDGVDRQDDMDSYSPQAKDFAYAYFRDELKAKDECNPDINIEMEGKDNNPHQRKFQDNDESILEQMVVVIIKLLTQEIGTQIMSWI